MATETNPEESVIKWIGKDVLSAQVGDVVLTVWAEAGQWHWKVTARNAHSVVQKTGLGVNQGKAVIAAEGAAPSVIEAWRCLV